MDQKSNKILYSASDLTGVLGISLSCAYNLMHAKGFPSFRLGIGKKGKSNLVVRHSDLMDWMDRQIVSCERSK